MFNLFKKKTEKFNDPDSLNFHRLTYGDIRPQFYMISDEFINFEEELNEILEKFFAGNIDAGNANVCDNIIEDVSRKALEDLNRQHDEHQESIDSLQARAVEDQLTLEKTIEYVTIELAEIDKNILYWKEKQQQYLSAK